MQFNIWKSIRLRLFLSHLAVSAIVIGSCVIFIILVWYPPPFANLDGIFSILIVMGGVDVCAGPLCTLVAASSRKGKRHLARDLAAIGFVQLLALGYAIYTMFIARPAFVVYGDGRFIISHANELTNEELAKASSPEFAFVPVSGPVFVEARVPDNPKELDQIASSVFRGGPAIKDMPRFYRKWPTSENDGRKWAKSVGSLPKGGPLRDAIERLLKQRHISDDGAIFLPISGKTDRGTVILRKEDLFVVGVIPLEP